MTFGGVEAVYSRGHAREEERRSAIRTSQRSVAARLFWRTNHTRSKRERQKASASAGAGTDSRCRQPASGVLLAAGKVCGAEVAAPRAGKTAPQIPWRAKQRKGASAEARGIARRLACQCNRG